MKYMFKILFVVGCLAPLSIDAMLQRVGNRLGLKTIFLKTQSAQLMQRSLKRTHAGKPRLIKRAGEDQRRQAVKQLSQMKQLVAMRARIARLDVQNRRNKVYNDELCRLAKRD